MGFLDRLILEATEEQVGGRPIWVVCQEFRYQYGKPGSRGLVTVYKNFRTDLASVPRLLWRIVPPWSGLKASVVHDYLYETQDLPRYLADSIFRMALADARVGPIRRWLMWAAVRLFGGPVFRDRKG